MARPFFLFLLIAGLPAWGGPDFAALRSLLKDAVARGTVAGGSVLVIHKGERVFGEGFGLADLEAKTPFGIETPAVIASISKPLIGTVAFRLAERGTLDLSAPVSNYLPEFGKLALESGEPVARAPTTIELLTHTSGLRHDDAPGGRPWFASWTAAKPLAEVVNRYASDFPMMARPGTRYAYSGIGTDVAARVLEVTSGRARNSVLAEELTAPLGMRHTFYRDAGSLERLPPMPSRYHRGADGGLLPAKERRLPPANTYCSSGGAIISTAPDLARWLLMIRNRGRHEGKAFLQPETVVAMLAGAPRGKNARSGFFIRKRDAGGKAVVVGHTGSSGTNCWIDFEHDLIGIMLTQTRGSQIKPFRIELERRVTACLAGLAPAGSPGN
ncbi:MAG: beta-lactamase family protein [Akkermansiaceae bacterium]|nr:beta-lactamase family protein [Akkermansiaceae bacterium]NNM28473.1 beta-lactamase family protein [Akkermansiaceae bacterium]